MVKVRPECIGSSTLVASSRPSRVLRSRVEERFPSSSLTRVAGELFRSDASGDAVGVARSPGHRLRAAVAALDRAPGRLARRRVGAVPRRPGTRNFGELVQVLEAFVNDLVFVGVAIYFLWNVEVQASASARSKRSTCCVRSRTSSTCTSSRRNGALLIARGPDTASSPERTMDAFSSSRDTSTTPRRCSRDHQQGRGALRPGAARSGDGRRGERGGRPRQAPAHDLAEDRDLGSHPVPGSVGRRSVESPGPSALGTVVHSSSNPPWIAPYPSQSSLQPSQLSELLQGPS